jgi:hypothetical protein
MSSDFSSSLVSSLVSSFSDSSLSDSSFSSILDSVWSQLGDFSASHQSKQLDSDSPSLSSLLSLFLLECSRSSLSTGEIVDYLVERQFPASKLSLLERSLVRHRTALRDQLSSHFVKSFPALVGASYRLDHVITSNLKEEIREPRFQIQLKLADKSESNDQQKPGQFEFTASLPDLQDLLAKVKEAVKQAQNEREQ